jgi:tRNA (mo5U34)-methyltransferase
MKSKQDLLQDVKKQKWFYEFLLPDGTKTSSYLPEVARDIHITREKVLRDFLINLSGDFSTALDISSHEGYFSIVLSEYFHRVIGVDKNQESVDKARLILSLLGIDNVEFINSSIEDVSGIDGYDFVLCYGLLYHVENPIELLRKVSALTRKTLCIETQVLPFDLSAPIEDGSYQWQRQIHGLFGICQDYSQRPEGGMTDLALIPSRNGLEFLLRQFGFRYVDFYSPEPSDYEQFLRGHRVIIFAEK